VASVSVMLVITNTIIITITYGDRGMVGAVAAERVPIPKERGTLQHRTGTAWRGAASSYGRRQVSRRLGEAKAAGT
jgi:hypothetical protein